jgi:hypothetical protein
MIVPIVGFAIAFSVLAYRHRKRGEHRTAIAELQRLGARLIMTTSESRNIGSMVEALSD